MKPSTYKKFRVFKNSLIKSYYKLVYPLAWLLNKIEERKNNNLKEKTTVDYAVNLFVKDIYKILCKNNYKKEDYVIIADYIDCDAGYNRPYNIIDYYAKFGSKTRKSINFLKREDLNYFIESTFKEFNNFNKYTYAYEKVEEAHEKDKWDIKGYQKTIYFGIRDE